MKNHFGICLRGLRRALLLVGLALLGGLPAIAIPLAEQPIFSTSGVPGNLVLALSVEFPTAVTAADRTTTYTSSTKYVGYFDPLRCYSYTYDDTTRDSNGVAYGSYFVPTGNALPSVGTSCNGSWSGNFMNWATMQAIDPFRWALTGGYRAVDEVGMTILEKAPAPSNQGSAGSNFPAKSVTSGAANVTPFSDKLYMRVLRCGTRMLFRLDGEFSGDDCPTSVTAWDGNAATPKANKKTTYSVEARVKVCTSDSLKESNCTKYGSNYKPEGLIQKYAEKIRFSAFGYLNDPEPTGGTALPREGGVMRARMKFVGPNQPVPGWLNGMRLPAVSSPTRTPPTPRHRVSRAPW